MDVIGFYPNIPHGEGLASLYKFLETWESKEISSSTLAEIAEIVLKIIYLNLMKKLSNKEVEPLLDRSLCLFMIFFLWLISRKKCLRILKKTTTMI